MGEKDAKKIFCWAAFAQISTWQNGNITPCRFLRHHVIGNLGEESLKSVWNGARIKSMRSDFLQGCSPGICRPFVDNMNCHKEFLKYKDPARAKLIQTEPPTRLHARLTGRCNLACPSCKSKKDPREIAYRSKVWTRSKKWLYPKLTEIMLLGGEPFIDPSTFQMIDEVALVNKNCRWSFTTNGHWTFTDEIKEKLDRIQIEEFRFSIDSLNPRLFSVLRKGGRLERALRTLHEMDAYRRQRGRQKRGFRMGINMVVQRSNYQEVPTVIEFCRKKKMSFIPLFCISPRPLSILAGSPKERAKAGRFFLKMGLSQGRHTRPILEKLVTGLKDQELKTEIFFLLARMPRYHERC